MNYLHSDKIKELEIKSDEIRKLMSDSLFEVGRECPTGLLGEVDLLTLLYFHVLKHDPKNPNWLERDHLIFSNNHIYAFYAILAHAGCFSIEELETIYKFMSHRRRYPLRIFSPDIETNFVSLESGLSQAVGMTLADRMDHGHSSDKLFYCLLDNKELQKRRNWEAMHLAGKGQLHNLIAIIDGNNIQTDGFKENTTPLESVTDKFEEFNWHVLNANSHDFDDMDNAIGQAQAVFAKPTVIIAQ